MCLRAQAPLRASLVANRCIIASAQPKFAREYAPQDLKQSDDGKASAPMANWTRSSKRCSASAPAKFFGTSVNDEIGRFLVGDIDGKGSKATRAYVGTDQSEWHHHFRTLFKTAIIGKMTRSGDPSTWST
jgi:hypothetical protein